ncbi:MAG: hypothetical protein ACUVQK_10275 [Thermogutta sp.]
MSSLVARMIWPGFVMCGLLLTTGCAGFFSGQFLTPSSRVRFFAANDDFQKMVREDPFPRAEQVGLKPLAAGPSCFDGSASR